MIFSFLRSLLFMVFIIVCAGASAETFSEEDTTAFVSRSFDQGSVDQYRQQADFIYESLPSEKLDFASIIWAYIAEMLDKIFTNDQQVNIYKIIFYGLMAAALIVLVLNLMGVDVRAFMGRDSKIFVTHEAAAENVREMNLDELIAQAQRLGDLRLVIRYQYLKALRVLSDKNFINWQSGKTNMDYYYEIKSQALKGDFLLLTSIYENIWYGNTAVMAEDYQSSKLSFERFYGLLNNREL